MIRFLCILILLGSARSAFAITEFSDSKAKARSYEEWRKSFDEMLGEGKKNLDSLIRDPDEIIGIEFLLAEPVPGSIVSGFGHAMLRFVRNSGSWVTDYVLSFSALIDEPETSNLKGLFGGYQAFPRISPLGEFWKEYVRGENRAVQRYIVPTNSKMRKKLLETLAHWYREPDTYLGNYTFLNHNCAALLTDLLETSEFGVKGELETIFPGRIADRLGDQLLNVYPPLRIETTKAVFEKTAVILGIDSDDLKKGKNWPEDASQKIVAAVSQKELFILLQEIPQMPTDVRGILQDHLTRLESEKQISLEEILGVQTVPVEFYQLCWDRACARSLIALSEGLWDLPTNGRFYEKRLELLHNLKFRPELWELERHLLELTVVHELDLHPELEKAFPEVPWPR